MTSPHAPRWHGRANLVPTPQAQHLLAHGRRAARWGSLLARWDLPDELRLPEDRPILFAANHRSFFDIVAALATFAHVGLSSRMLVRADVFDTPVVGRWIRDLGCIPTSRDVRDAAERTAIETLEAGQTVAMMPEGRLVPASDRPHGVGEARQGVGRIAAATGAAVVPVAIHDSDRVWPRGRLPRLPLRGRPTVTVRIGEPVPFVGDPRADAERLMSTIAGMLAAVERQRHDRRRPSPGAQPSTAA